MSEVSVFHIFPKSFDGTLSFENPWYAAMNKQSDLVLKWDWNQVLVSSVPFFSCTRCQMEKKWDTRFDSGLLWNAIAPKWLIHHYCHVCDLLTLILQICWQVHRVGEPRWAGWGCFVPGGRQGFTRRGHRVEKENSRSCKSLALALITVYTSMNSVISQQVVVMNETRLYLKDDATCIKVSKLPICKHLVSKVWTFFILFKWQKM